jgi:hypothetical protein
MNTTLRTNVIAATALASLGFMSRSATAVPITGQYIEDPRCDVIPNTPLTHELCDAATFPTNEAITVFVSPTQTTVCVPNDGIQNDWNVQITNVSGQAWTDLFFVANFDNGIGNSDGVVVDPSNAAILSDAFRIDSTGANNSLVENFAMDGIFAPGETWRFMVSNFQHPSGVSPVPSFISPGTFAGSANVTVDSASILANPVPEPATVGVLALAGAATLMRRRRGA